MEQNNNGWGKEGSHTWQSTLEPGVSVSIIEENVPSLTVAAVVGVTLVVIIAIVIIFLLGVFIDCRHQRLVEQKKGQSRRTKPSRKASAHPDGEEIVTNMEQPDLSPAPAEFLRTIP